MKKFLILALVAVISQSLYAQAEYNRVVRYMTSLGWKQSVTDRYANLKEGQVSAWDYRSFYANLQYAVVAFSESSNDDVNLKIQYSDGTPFMSDNYTDSWAIIYFTLYTQQTMRIQMENSYAIDPSYSSRCRYIVFYR